MRYSNMESGIPKYQGYTTKPKLFIVLRNWEDIILPRMIFMLGWELGVRNPFSFPGSPRLQFMRGFEVTWLMDGYPALIFKRLQSFPWDRMGRTPYICKDFAEENKELQRKGIKAVTEFYKRRRQGEHMFVLSFSNIIAWSPFLPSSSHPTVSRPRYVSSSVLVSFQSVHWTYEACGFPAVEMTSWVVLAACVQGSSALAVNPRSGPEPEPRPLTSALWRFCGPPSPGTGFCLVQCFCAVLPCMRLEYQYLDTHWSLIEMCAKWARAKPGNVEGQLNVAAEVWRSVRLYRFNITCSLPNCHACQYSTPCKKWMALIPGHVQGRTSVS